MDSTTALTLYIDTLISAQRSESVIKVRKSALRRLARETGIELLDQSAHSIRRHLQFLTPTMRSATALYLRNFYAWALAENLIGEDPAPPHVKTPSLLVDPLDLFELGVVEAFEKHLRYRNLAECTVDHYLRSIRRLRAALGPLEDIALADLEQYLLAQFQPASRRSEVSRLKNFYRWSEATQHLTANPTTALVSPRVPSALPRPISEKNLKQLLKTARPQMRPCYLLAGWAGLRVGEIARLCAEDLLLEGDRPTIRIPVSKGRHEDVLPLGRFLTRELRKCGLPESGWIYPLSGDPTQHRKAGSLSQSTTRHFHTLGFEGGLHTLRFRFGTKLYDATMNLRVTQKLMRHTNPSTTARYILASEKDLTDAVDLLPPL